MAADDTRVRAAAAVGARDSRPARASPARSVCDRPCGLEAAGRLLRALAPPKSEGTGYCANIAGEVVASDSRRPSTSGPRQICNLAGLAALFTPPIGCTETFEDAAPSPSPSEERRSGAGQ